MGEGVINRDYIGYITNNNGQLEYAEEPIGDESSVFLDSIMELNETEGSTIEDLWREFKSFKDSHQLKFWFRGYCIDCDDYYDPVFDSVKEPVLFMLQRQINSEVRECRKDYRGIPSEELQEIIDSIKSSYKDELCRDICDFSTAINYEMTLHELLERNPNVVLYSHDYKGWDNIMYQNITDDIDISIKSNFFYGKASYFVVCLRYKGVDILPYSKLVEYRFAKMADLIKGTVFLEPERRQWLTAFKYVLELADEAKTQEEQFIRRFIVDDVEKLIRGLKKIYHETKSEYRRLGHSCYSPWWILRFENEVGMSRAYMSNTFRLEEEKERYEVSERELVECFKFEKITYALEYLDNLSVLAENTTEKIKAVVCNAMGEIVTLNEKIVPQIKKLKKDIDSEIDSLANELEEVVRECEECEESDDENEKVFCNTKKQQLNELFERRTAVSDLLSGYIEKISQYTEHK